MFKKERYEGQINVSMNELKLRLAGGWAFAKFISESISIMSSSMSKYLHYHRVECQPFNIGCLWV